MKKVLFILICLSIYVFYKVEIADSPFEKAQKACISGKFDTAHKVLVKAREKAYEGDPLFGEWQDEYFDEYAQIASYVYGEEAKYLMSYNPNMAMSRIKIMIADLKPSGRKPQEGEEWYRIFADTDNTEKNKYYAEAKLYNDVLSKIVDYLLSLDMVDEATQIANKGLAIPYVEKYKLHYGSEDLEILQKIDKYNADKE